MIYCKFNFIYENNVISCTILMKENKKIVVYLYITRPVLLTLQKSLLAYHKRFLHEWIVRNVKTSLVVYHLWYDND